MVHYASALIPHAAGAHSSGLPAQTDLSTIRGNATDQTGAAVPHAKITVTDVGTNISREAVTTSDGVYELPYLAPGTYRLTATGSGFKTFVAQNIIMTARQTRRIDFAFELGAISNEVTVSANAAVINTEGSQALDGVPSDGPVNLVQNMNDFDDLQVVGANNSTEFSRVSNFSMTGRSGTNAFHGRAFWDFQSSALNTRGFFDTQNAKYHNHHAGVSLAGPIRKNKTFFYTAYYPARVPGSTFYNRSVATDAFRAGTFSQLSTTIKDPLSGLPFPNNAIPANRINSTSAKVQDSYIPKANQGGANAQTNNYGWLFPCTSDLYRWDSFTERIDHQFSSKNTLFGRYMDRIMPYVLAGSFPEVGTWTRTRYHNSIVVTDTYVFSPTVVNTARWGWQKDKINDGSTVNGFTPVNGDTVVKNLGLQGVNPRGYSAEGFPNISITGITALTVQPGGLATLARNFDYSDSMTWSRGAHVLKFGGELRTFRSFSATVPTGTYGQFGFDGTFTGNAYADFLLGIPYSSTRVDPIVERAMRSYELGLFITDTWKATRKLTLDYGLRWDYKAS